MLAVVIADHAEDRELTSHALRGSGLQVATYKDVASALQAAADRPFDLAVLATYHLPHAKRSLAALRQETGVPIIVVIEGLNESQHCDFLDDGADLVLQRPVSYRLLSRYAHIFLRRTHNISISILAAISAGDVRLDPSNRAVTVRGGEPQRLTQLEFQLLYVLMTNAGQVIPVDELVELVWGYQGEGNRDLVRGLVRRLRRKIEPAAGQPRFIHNLPGIGYRFSTES